MDENKNAEALYKLDVFAKKYCKTMETCDRCAFKYGESYTCGFYEIFIPQIKKALTDTGNIKIEVDEKCQICRWANLADKECKICLPRSLSYQCNGSHYERVDNDK